jgi:hypothetical protein
MTGSIKLKDHPGDMVRIVCEKCERRSVISESLRSYLQAGMGQRFDYN